MTKPRVLLFDIDGTLLKAHGAGRRAINRAFQQFFGVEGAIDHVELQGMTDPLIMKAGLSALGQPAHRETIDRLLEQYLVYLDEELVPTDSTELLPGVVELLRWLKLSSTPIAIGLGTGNVEAGARAKLARVGLMPYFEFGGYGSDHELRSEVLRVGARRGAEQLRQPLEQCRTVVIGDTSRDIDAARAIGAECLAVATGSSTVYELLRHGATYVIKNLAEPAVFQFLSATGPTPLL